MKMRYAMIVAAVLVSVLGSMPSSPAKKPSSQPAKMAPLGATTCSADDHIPCGCDAFGPEWYCAGSCSIFGNGDSMSTSCSECRVDWPIIY